VAAHVIEVDPFNSLSVTKADRELNRLIEEFNHKVDDFIERLAKIGADAASGAYGSAVAVSVEPIENGMAIKAESDAVVFLEFGAGSTVNTGNKYADEMPFDVWRGSFSDQAIGRDGKPPGMYARTGYRFWLLNNGVKITHVEPRNGMQKAYDAIVKDIHTVANEVFK
jgi:hypothetical protein